MAGYSKETARLWMAMDIGPLWIGRDEDDPLSPQSIAKDSTAKEITASQSRSRNKIPPIQTPLTRLQRLIRRRLTSTQC